jgi:hypothetical protein
VAWQPLGGLRPLQSAQRRLRLAVDQLEQGLRGGLHGEAILLPVAQSGDRNGVGEHQRIDRVLGMLTQRVSSFRVI